MIIVKKSGYLKYKNLKFRCAFGKNGIKKKTKEGDKITPVGIFKITKIYYRQDKIKKIKTLIKKIKISYKSCHWRCGDDWAGKLECNSCAERRRLWWSRWNECDGIRQSLKLGWWRNRRLRTRRLRWRRWKRGRR